VNFATLNWELIIKKVPLSLSTSKFASLPRYNNEDKELNFTVTKVQCLFFSSAASEPAHLSTSPALLDNTVQGLDFSASDSYLQTFVEFLERREIFVYVGRHQHRNVWEIYTRVKCSAVLTLLLLSDFWLVEAKFSVLLDIT
jgi:hypothetical protein